MTRLDSRILPSWTPDGAADWLDFPPAERVMAIVQASQRGKETRISDGSTEVTVALEEFLRRAVVAMTQADQGKAYFATLESEKEMLETRVGYWKARVSVLQAALRSLARAIDEITEQTEDFAVYLPLVKTRDEAERIAASFTQPTLFEPSLPFSPGRTEPFSGDSTEEDSFRIPVQTMSERPESSQQSHNVTERPERSRPDDHRDNATADLNSSEPSYEDGLLGAG